MSPAGVGSGRGRIRRANSPYQATTPVFHSFGNVVRSKTSRGEGLVPRWGGGGDWQNPPCQFAAYNRNSGFSYLGVPAEAGMGDWYENDITRPGECPHSTAPALVVLTPHSSFRRKPESRRAGRGNVVRPKTTRGEGFVPRSRQTGNQP